jgi:hypothetical protein
MMPNDPLAQLELEEDIMSAKIDPNDCYHRALPGEPRFTLLGRDPMFHRIVMEWADFREYQILVGERPLTDRPQVDQARDMASRAQEWRRQNLGAWRKK